MNFDRLRFVVERANIGENREALLSICLPETQGALVQFCQYFSEISGNREYHITEFSYSNP